MGRKKSKNPIKDSKMTFKLLKSQKDKYIKDTEDKGYKGYGERLREHVRKETGEIEKNN